MQLGEVDKDPNELWEGLLFITLKSSDPATEPHKMIVLRAEDGKYTYEESEDSPYPISMRSIILPK